MFFNVIKSYRDVVAVCDSELLGEKFEEPLENNKDVIRQLDVKESFYKGKEGKKVSESELIELLKNFSREDATFNIVGEKSVNAALKAGIISKEHIDRIQGVPFILILL